MTLPTIVVLVVGLVLFGAISLAASYRSDQLRADEISAFIRHMEEGEERFVQQCHWYDPYSGERCTRKDGHKKHRHPHVIGKEDVWARKPSRSLSTWTDKVIESTRELSDHSGSSSEPQWSTSEKEALSALFHQVGPTQQSERYAEAILSKPKDL